VLNASNVIGMAMWRDLQTWLGRLPARHVGPQRPPMGGTDSRPTWIKPEKAVAEVDTRVAPREHPAV
jgi:hypothetical protein